MEECEIKLDQFGLLVGLVNGQFNELSVDNHMLIEQMAVSRVNIISRKKGKHI